ncbi:MAG: TIGR02611 family protein [Actinomycetes bacterium]
MSESVSSEQGKEPTDLPGPDWLYRLRKRFTGNSALRRLVWRVLATMLGVAIIVGGVVMVIFPGPGWAAIFLGLAVLATEYAWANRLLVATKDKAGGAASSVFAPENRKRSIVLSSIVVLLVAAIVAWYVYQYGWTTSGALGWFGLG